MHKIIYANYHSDLLWITVDVAEDNYASVAQ